MPGVLRRVVAVSVALTVLAGCSQSGTASPETPQPGPSSTGATAAAAVQLSPADGAKDVPPGDPISASSSGSRLKSVTLTDEKGAAVSGTLAEDGKHWTPSAKLKYSTGYKLEATADDGQGMPITRTSSFTTATAKATSYPSVIPLDGETVGVGMPLIIKFSKPVTDHAAAEKMLTVTSAKPVTGAWKWFGDDEVHYRTKDYWPAYTKIKLDIKIGGRALGGGVFGETDRTIAFQTGASIISKVSDKDKQLRVIKDGVPVLTAPTSLGKPSALSVSGTLLIMTVQSPYTMDSSTYGVPADAAGGYRTTVKYALRLTNSGQFLHSAPWSVADQGKRNVSHGCLNVSVDNAKWFFDNSHRGDVVIVTDTGDEVKPGDGWTDWRFSWDEWTKR
ncbi:L,D-transpeptidase [Amycolatopsis sp. NPDC003861]